MELLRNRSGTQSRQAEPLFYEPQLGVLRWARRHFRTSLGRSMALFTIGFSVIFMLWVVILMIMNRTRSPPSEQNMNQVVQFAWDEIRRMANGQSESLHLLGIVSHNIKTETLPDIDAPIDTMDELVLRIGSDGVVFDHHLTVSTDSSGLSAITKYTCSYESSARRYSEVSLPGSSTSRAMAPVQLRIMSVNTWNYNHWVQRLPLLKETFLLALPDIVTFQEVRARKVGSDGRNRFMSDDLRAMLPDMQFVFVPAMRFREGDEIVHEGLAIFSRFPIHSYRVTKLSQNPSDPGDFHQRILLSSSIYWGGPGKDDQGRLVHVMTTHLSLSESARDRTIPEIFDAVQAASQGGIHPVVLTGDFNAERVSASKHFPTMRDAWVETHPDTVDRSKGYTFNSWYPKSRIDYIFTKDLRAVHCSVVGGEGRHVPGGLAPGHGVANTRDTLFSSDHTFPFAILQPGE